MGFYWFMIVFFRDQKKKIKDPKRKITKEKIVVNFVVFGLAKIENKII